MAVPPSLLPSHSEKVIGAMKAERTVRRLTFNPTSANPGEALYVSVPKLAEKEVIVAGSLALVFNINLKVTGAHANNYLVQNVSRALVDKFIVKFGDTIVQDTVAYDIYKIFEDLFLSMDERENMLREGIQSVDLNRIRSGAGDKKTTGVDAENALNGVYGTKYRINLDHPILTDHGVFYPPGPLSQLGLRAHPSPSRPSGNRRRLQARVQAGKPRAGVRGNKKQDPGRRGDERIQQRQGVRVRPRVRPRERVVPITRGSDTHLNLQVNPQRRSLKGILLLFINPYTAGARDTEHYFNPGITKVKFSVNGVPNRVYNEGLSGSDMWQGTHPSL